MTRANTALLPDRGVVRVSGPDAEKLLQGIITNDMDLLAGQRAMHTALLTPQGKLLFEFFVARDGAEFVLETARDQADALVKRLSMYKLRARADIRDASAEHGVIAAWGPPPQSTDEHAVSFPDPRLPDLGVRMLVASKIASLANRTDGTADDYHAHRISLGVPEAGKDYALGDTFPHEANFDLLHGVSFSKGCFVGQEVVSRMQHRGTARKRIVIVEAAEPLRSGSEIAAGSAILGTVGSVAGRRGLALVRLDRVEEAQAKGQGLAAAGAEVAVRLPGYMKAAAAADAP